MKKEIEQEYEIIEIKLAGNALERLKKATEFLQLFLPVTLARPCLKNR